MYPLNLLCFHLLFSIPYSLATDRHYYIAAIEVEWDYVPSGRNLVTNENKKFREKTENRRDRIGSVYRKAIYRGYTDQTFTQQLPVPEWAGILGPPIKAEVGDTVYIHFKNMATGSNFSVHPHGFLYDKINEGALYIDGTHPFEKYEDAVPPGGTVTYMWEIGKEHRQKKDETTVLLHKSLSIQQVNLLFPGTLDSKGRRKDADQELYLYADVTDENNSWYADINLNKCGNPNVCRNLKRQKNRKFISSNSIPHINGYLFGNLPDFTVCEGEKVIWYFMSINRGIIQYNYLPRWTDTAVLFPASVYSGHMTPVNPGRWLLYCKNLDHFEGGMSSFLTVLKCPPAPAGPLVPPKLMFPTLIRTYYLAIEEVLWDYAPGFDSRRSKSAAKFLNRGRQRIGSVYKKAIYIEYIDDTFTLRKPRGDHEMHHGLAGPPIKAQVGERVVVVVLNRASRPYSFLANGIEITKEHEGAYYKNQRHDEKMTGAIVMPGTIRTYEYNVNEHVGPTPLNEDCITYVYHSAVDVTKDVYSGLFGPLLVCKRGTLNFDGCQVSLINLCDFRNYMRLRFSVR
ncbi:ferroxidase HEPHL1-like, partial [Ruditapes philippinarum]|uniref:ferroxidase HEPHL1-like n=1 Tax=Ruditapes philippinarum TaxID=129788 RepID=UPI00295BE4D5